MRALRVDFPFWTAVGWECPTGRVSFLRNSGLALCSGRILVLCEGVLSYVLGSKSYVQGSKSYVQGSKSYVQGSKSYVQVAKFSSSVFL